MNFFKTKIPDVIIVETPKFGDHRGFFMETYHTEKFFKGGIKTHFVQDNFASSQKNILRGLHYQFKFPQGKLVRCIKGEILDVAVDIRINSSTFGKWISEVLSKDNLKQLYIPPGFAHGYLVLSESAEVMYKCTELYHPEDEYGLLWNDPDIGINWGIECPILSEKDRNLPLLKDIGDKIFK